MKVLKPTSVKYDDDDDDDDNNNNNNNNTYIHTSESTNLKVQ